LSKFHQIVLRKFIFIFFILFLIVGTIVYYWSKEFYISQTQASLLNNIKIIYFELNKDSNFEILAKKVKENLDLRLTIISQDGTVIAESHKDKSKMDNHKYRDEIIQANKEDFGYKIRYSTTIDTELLYIAKKYNLTGEILYIRLSKELKSINKQISLLAFKMSIVVTIFFISIFIITYRISKEIEWETLKIVSFLKSPLKSISPFSL